METFLESEFVVMVALTISTLIVYLLGNLKRLVFVFLAQTLMSLNNMMQLLLIRILRMNQHHSTSLGLLVNGVLLLRLQKTISMAT
jgi:hypothetical protein